MAECYENLFESLAVYRKRYKCRPFCFLSFFKEEDKTPRFCNRLDVLMDVLSEKSIDDSVSVLSSRK